MAKPTFHSVTQQPCACSYLENEANDPDSPILFDASTGEFQFSFGDAMLILYHCPTCGGVAPKSKRELLFAVIPSDE